MELQPESGKDVLSKLTVEVFQVELFSTKRFPVDQRICPGKLAYGSHI